MKISESFPQTCFPYHPDKNPGHEKEAEEIQGYKRGLQVSIAKRQDYILPEQFANHYAYRTRAFAIPRGHSSDTFTNRATIDDLNRMLAQAGLRFYQDFFYRVFLNSKKSVFRVYYGSAGPLNYGSANVRNSPPEQRQVTAEAYKPGLIERWFTKVMLKISGFALRKLLGVQNSPALDNQDNTDLEVSRLILCPAERTNLSKR
jgi:hypothetical protein